MTLKPEDLKPCPFCGGEAHVVEDRDGPLLHRPQCKRCGASRGGLHHRGNAIKAWNQRAAREEARPDPRPSPVGREEVARWICRTVRIAQGFKGTAEYTLDDEVHNAWDDWLVEADDLLALFSPADGWRPIEPRLRRFVDPFHGHEFYFDPTATAMIKNAHGQATFVMRDGSHYSTTTSYEEALRMVGAAAPTAPVAPVDGWQPIETAEACDAKQD